MVPITRRASSLCTLRGWRLVLLLALSFSHLTLTLSFLCSSVSESLLSLSFSFLSECFVVVFVHATAALAYSMVLTSQCACLGHVIPPTQFGIRIFCMGFLYRQTDIHIRECGSTFYVGLARTAPPTNTNFRLTFLLTRLQEALYEDLAV